MKKYLLLILSLSFLISCEQEKEFDTTMDLREEVAKKVHICTADFYSGVFDDELPNTKAGILNSKQWANNSVIRVKFLNGSSYLQQKVKQYAVEWSKY
ncbi:hypothetical protein, partial [Dysgonomonas mossii]|uniref:hypothetical protein n=2 Tax=Dysgonomonas TaxID=156973 RepID=UPI001AC2F6BB